MIPLLGRIHGHQQHRSRGTSLEVQGSRPCACKAGGAGLIPGPGIKIPHATEQLSPSAATKTMQPNK